MPICVLLTEVTFPAHWGRSDIRYDLDVSLNRVRVVVEWEQELPVAPTSSRESAVSSRLGSPPTLDVAWLALLSSILIIFGSYHSRKHRVRVHLDHLMIVAMKTEIQVIPWGKRYQCSLTLWLLMLGITHQHQRASEKGNRQHLILIRDLFNVYYQWPFSDL